MPAHSFVNTDQKLVKDLSKNRHNIGNKNFFYYVCPLVSWSRFTTLYFVVFILTAPAKCSSDLDYGPCLPARDWGNRVRPEFLKKCLNWTIFLF